MGNKGGRVDHGNDISHFRSDLQLVHQTEKKMKKIERNSI